MRKKPFFTIIIPTYNRLKYLKEAVQSVKNQTFDDWVLHIVDNTSCDGTYSYLKSLVKEDSRIKFSRLNNNGIIAVSRNLALKSASSKAVSFLDDDDIWLPNKLKDDYEILKKREALVYSKIYLFNEENGYSRKLASRIINYKSPVFDLLHYGNIITTSTVSFSLNSLTKKQLFNESRSLVTWEDYEYWVRLIKDCHLIPLSNQKYNTKYRLSNSQYSSPSQDIKNAKLISVFFENYYKYFKIRRIKDLPLWATYNNMISYFFLKKYKYSFFSFIQTCIISLKTFDFYFLCKSTLRYFLLLLKN